MLWFYFTGAAILIGGEVNSDIEDDAARAGSSDAKRKGQKNPSGHSPKREGKESFRSNPNDASSGVCGDDRSESFGPIAALGRHLYRAYGDGCRASSGTASVVASTGLSDSRPADGINQSHVIATSGRNHR
jgi:hypothetical protein